MRQQQNEVITFCFSGSCSCYIIAAKLAAGSPDDAQQCYEVRYYEEFIDGCVDADNSREICDRFAEAG
jgi:hypothetical protein